MIRDVLESIKYVGYLYPVALLRIYMGYLFLVNARSLYKSDFVRHPKLAAEITEWIPFSQAPEFYIQLLDSFVVPNWKIFAYIIIYLQLVIGISFVAGFLVRLTSIIGILLSMHFIFAHGQPSVELYQMHLVFFILCLVCGAGRCLGLDYFFYKRQRGLFW